MKGGVERFRRETAKEERGDPGRLLVRLARFLLAGCKSRPDSHI
jgi:hypothetical protein